MVFKEHICTQLFKLNFNINNSHIFTRKHPFAPVIFTEGTKYKNQSVVLDEAELKKRIIPYSLQRPFLMFLFHVTFIERQVKT